MNCRPLRAFGLPALLCGVLVAGAPAAVAGEAGSETVGRVQPTATTPQAPAVGPEARRLTAEFRVQTGSVRGNAWNADNTPIPNARLRLRNVKSGRMAATTTANELGQFEFSNVAAGAYVVEFVDENGRIVAVGHTFTSEPGGTVATFVRMSAKVPWFRGFFGNAAAAIAATAAATGITAVSPDAIRCVSNCG